MIIVFGFVLLVLAGALVLLFAMFGELASRVGTHTESLRNDRVEPLEDATLGAVPGNWPAELAEVADAEHALLIVVSSSCRNCADVMSQLSADAATRADVFVLVSCPTARAGREFVAAYETSGLRYHIDEYGSWVGTEFNVHVSPVGLVLRDGRLDSALMFTSVAALRAEAGQLVGHSS
jgi:hypothetical protein